MTEVLTKVFVCGGGCEPKCGKCGEQQVIELTPEEVANYQAAIESANQLEAERLAAEEALAALKASARAKLVAGEPLTEEEAATLVI